MLDQLPQRPRQPRVPIVVMERSGQWTAALRRELPPATVRLIETRTLEECFRRLAEWPKGFAAIELSEERIEPLLAGLLRMERRYPEARAIVLAGRGLAAYADLLREAGAGCFVSSIRSLAAVAELVRRRAARLAAASEASAGGDDLLAEVLADLPWSDEYPE
jgi:hypothetical protein